MNTLKPMATYNRPPFRWRRLLRSIAALARFGFFCIWHLATLCFAGLAILTLATVALFIMGLI